MEVHARYTLMGAFTIAVIAAGFLFVHWLQTGGGLTERVSYRVEFEGSVAGLSKGSAVLLNGMRVGEVTALSLDQQRPTTVLVDIAVERTAPVRTDTAVGIEFQGLAGAPAVSMNGGTLASPLLAATSAEKRRLSAEKNAGQSMTQAAREVLRKLDVLVAENTTAFTSAVANIDRFAGALARNSEKVDNIVAGIERLTGGGPKPVMRVFDIGAATDFPAIAAFPKGQMLVPEPTTLANLENERIVISGGEKAAVENAQWPDLLPRVVQSGLVRSFENAGYKRILARVPDGARSDYQLLVDIRRFHAVAGPAGGAEVELAIRILKADGSVTDVRVFRAALALAALDPETVAQGLGTAFRRVAAEVVAWVCGAA